METIYPYGVAKIRMKETYLLSNHTFNTLAEENEIERILMVLHEHGYHTEGNSRDEILKIEEKKLYDLMQEVSENANFWEVFLIHQDYHNLKILTKAHFLGNSCSSHFMPEGRLSLAQLTEATQIQDFSSLPDRMKEAMTQIKTLSLHLANCYKIDFILDQAYSMELSHLAKATNIPFVIEYVTKMIDIMNLKSFLRIFYAKQGLSILQEAFLEGGSISKESMEKAFLTDNPILMLQHTGYGDLISHMLQDGNYDKIGDNALMDFMKQAKLKALTIEPIISYWYAKNTEIKNVRILLQAKVNQVPPNQIKERLREAYV